MRSHTARILKHNCNLLSHSHGLVLPACTESCAERSSRRERTHEQEPGTALPLLSSREVYTHASTSLSLASFEPWYSFSVLTNTVICSMNGACVCLHIYLTQMEMAFKLNNRHDTREQWVSIEHHEREGSAALSSVCSRGQRSYYSIPQAASHPKSLWITVCKFTVCSTPVGRFSHSTSFCPCPFHQLSGKNNKQPIVSGIIISTKS